MTSTYLVACPRNPAGNDGPNMYHYVNANVVNKIDFDGLFTAEAMALYKFNRIVRLGLCVRYGSTVIARAEAREMDPPDTENKDSGPNRRSNGFKLLHCLEACEASKTCDASVDEVQIGRILYEIYKSYEYHNMKTIMEKISYMRDTYGDLSANLYGAEVCPKQTCKERCKNVMS